MKMCTSCNTEKELSEFKPHKLSPDGLGYWCMSCRKQFTQDYNKQAPNVLSRLYSGMVGRSKRRNQPLLSFTRKDFIDWANHHDFSSIYKGWVESGFQKDMKPSIDRIDDFKIYVLSNMRLTTWKDNNSQTKQKLCRKVKRLSDGKIFISILHASKELCIPSSTLYAKCQRNEDYSFV